MINKNIFDDLIPTFAKQTDFLLGNELNLQILKLYIIKHVKNTVFAK